MQPNEWLSWICSSEDGDQLRAKYDQWARTYDTVVGDVWGVVPQTAAWLLAEHVSDRQRTIFDVGAGTGLAGVALAALGFQQIVGMDPSPGMLTQARDKGVYRSLVCCSIGDEVCAGLGQAHGIVATGVFAESHAGATELRKLQDMLCPGGVVVFTARRSFLPDLEEVLCSPAWTLLDSRSLPIYEDPVHLGAYTVR